MSTDHSEAVASAPGGPVGDEFSAAGEDLSAPGEDFSAGGVVVRGEDVIVIIPARRKRGPRMVLGLPKGHLDGDETPLQAAIREVREETGVEADPVCELGEIRYRYERKHGIVDKRVRFYLFDYRSGDLRPDREVEEVRWMPLQEAVSALTYDGEREVVARALARLGENGRTASKPRKRPLPRRGPAR